MELPEAEGGRENRAETRAQADILTVNFVKWRRKGQGSRMRNRSEMDLFD